MGRYNGFTCTRKTNTCGELTMETRPLTIDDLQDVITLENSIPHDNTWEPSTDEDQRPIITAGNAFGIFENNVLAGKVGFIDTKNDGWQVDGLCVDKLFRGKKYGKTLFAYAVEQIIRKEHPNQLMLYVYLGNSSAIIIYLQTGFVIQDFIKDKYGPGKHRLKLIQKLS